MELTGQRALVTGGTAGIGLASARLLSEAGAAVVITGRNADRGVAVADQLGAQFLQADLGAASEVQHLFQAAGEIDILVNNAAYFPAALTVDQDPTSFDETFGINVRGLYFLTAGIVRGMLARSRGSIVNITTMVATKGVARASAYSASKAAVESLTRTWAVEFGASGIRVNSVAPGPTRTEGVQAEWGDSNEELGRSMPLGRTADPAEIAQAVLFLASPRSSFITGSTLHVDGGGAAL
ncbi:SDR family oxidoreductase [Mycolicibacterium neoaurum]|uniref:SDR family NAD(P)-dependent oxidoreductase n=1 Tax=Mycolicibacterium neoaurum TaxID=1795 RepID=UPI0026731CEE|nr:SDR family oxidoreductase [Mycolicibacterium neoaurum]MDO3403166.1 SDR family oxidoreductase [Mycolicibacterium neoaurum]